MDKNEFGRHSETEAALCALCDRAERVCATKDFPTRITLLQNILTEVRAIDAWSSKYPRQAFLGRIEFELGYAYRYRDDGLAAENLELAANAFERCIAILPFEGNADTWAQARLSLGDVILRRKGQLLSRDLERAISVAEEALSSTYKDKDLENWKYAHLVRAHAGFNLLLIQRNREEIREAVIESYEACLAVSSQEDSNWAYLNKSLAEVYFDRKLGVYDMNLNRVTMHCESALARLSPETDRLDWAGAKVMLALAASKTIDPTNTLMNVAIEAARAATKNLDESEDPHVFAGAHAALALILTRRAHIRTGAEWEEAMISFAKALRAYEREQDVEGSALVQADLGAALLERHFSVETEDIARAIEALEIANASLTVTDHRNEVLEVREALGIAYLKRSQTIDSQERAIQTFESALSLLSEDDDPEAWGCFQMHLSSVLAERLLEDHTVNIQSALEKADSAVRALEKSSSLQGLTTAKINLAVVMSKVGFGVNPAAIEKAIVLLEEARSLLTAADGENWRITNVNLAGLYLERETEHPEDGIEAALKYCDAALEGIDPETMPSAWINVQMNRSAALYRRVKGDPALNRDLAIAAFRAILELLPPEADPKRHLITARRLGLALAEEHKFQEAYSAFLSALAAAELLLSAGLEIRDTYHSLYESREVWSDAAYCAYRMGEPWTALELVERGRARLLRNSYRFDQSAQEAKTPESPIQLLRAIQESQLQLQHTHGLGRVKCLDCLRDLRERLAYELPRETDHIFAGRSSIRELVRDVTSDGTTVVVQVLSSIGVLAFVSRAGVSDIEIEVLEYPQRVYSDLEDLLGRTVSPTSAAGFLVDAAAFGAQEIGEKQWSSVLEGISDRMSALLFDRVVDALENLGLITGAPVALISGYAVSLMPVAMMRAGRTNERFIDRFELRVAPSLSSLATARDRVAAQIQSTRRLAALVDTKGDLPFARLEGSLVSSWFRGEKEGGIIDNKVSKETIMAVLSESNYWHFACHGSFDQIQPEKTGLRLARGRFLSVEDLYNHLRACPRLVVLSACETGLQDISFVPYEAFGLLGAMLHAGAAAAIGTLWRVNDLSAALLSARFYECLIGGRQLPAAALREAQIWIRDTNCRCIIDYITKQETLGRIPAALASPARCHLYQNFKGEKMPYADPLHWAGWIVMGI